MSGSCYNCINTLWPRQNGRHFADDIFKCIFFNKNVWIPIKVSLKFVPKGPINNIPASVQIMAWRRPGNKPLSEPMMVVLPTHICVTRPQWVKRAIDVIWVRIVCIILWWNIICHGLILWKINLSLLWKLIFWKPTTVGSPPNFSKLISQPGHLSHGESLNRNILSCYYQTHIEHIF